MMEATAAGTAVNLARSVVSVAGSAVVRLMGVPREVQFIDDELEMMKSFLQVASERPDAATRNAMVRTWVKQVRNLSYDFEDCLSDIELYSATDYRWSSWLPGALAARHSIVTRIRGLKASIEELDQRNLRYQFVLDAFRGGLSAAEGDVLWASEITYQESEIIGRGRETAELKCLISRRDEYDCALSVVSVWGMGAMGKSSLVSLVRNDPEVIYAYDGIAWVTVPHPLDSTDELVRPLREQLGLGTAVVHDNDRDIMHYVKNKRYLIVVDDLLTKEEWDQVWPKLSNFQHTRGSCIIVTTRREDVALYCAGSVPEVHGTVYELKPLGERESITLLCWKVYNTTMCTLPFELEEQAICILRRCWGLPLAISTIGGILAARPKTRMEWMTLHENLAVELQFGFQDIRKVIALSYDGLPYNFKPIYLYLSIFRENHEIRYTRMLRRWMAEGYIKKNKDYPMEQVGEFFYKELIGRSIIEPSKKKISLGHRVNRCLIHNMVLENICSKAVEENQLFLIEKQCEEVPHSKIRHLVVSRWKTGKKLKNIILSYIRSLTVYGDCPVALISPSMRLLRVLDLEDTTNLNNKDLSNIGDLPHLRYLCVRGTKISQLPDSLKNLRYLETLDIQDTQVTQLPHQLFKLDKLRYVLAGVRFSRDLLQKMVQLEMENQKNNIFGNIASILCCEHSDHRKASNMDQLSVRTPNDIVKLRNLHVVGVFNVGQENGDTRSLEKLTNLQKLGVTVTSLTEKGSLELCRSIGKLNNLKKLEVRSYSLEFLAKMVEVETPKHLVSLKLLGNLSSLPRWITSLNDLTKLKLLGTNLEHGQVDILGGLHSLAFMGLWEKSYKGDSLKFNVGSFPKLKFLDIDGLEKIEKVKIKLGAMPELEQLWVNNCKALLNSSDGLSGLPNLPKLNELLLKKCGDKDKLMEILELQISFHIKRPKFLVGKSVLPTSSMPSTSTAGS